VAELEPGGVRDLCLQAEPALAPSLPSQPEPLMEAPGPVAPPKPEHAPEHTPEHVSVQALEPAAAPLPALLLPDLPEPLVELRAPVAPAAPAAATALAALADAQAVP
jgi:hypothetical protein